MGYKQPLLDDKVNDMKEISEEEWRRLSRYLHQFEPEVQSVEDVLTWKNPRHSMAVFFIINSVFLW